MWRMPTLYSYSVTEVSPRTAPKHEQLKSQGDSMDFAGESDPRRERITTLQRQLDREIMVLLCHYKKLTKMSGLETRVLNVLNEPFILSLCRSDKVLRT